MCIHASSLNCFFQWLNTILFLAHLIIHCVLGSPLSFLFISKFTFIECSLCKNPFCFDLQPLHKCTPILQLRSPGLGEIHEYVMESVLGAELALSSLTLESTMT